MPNKKNIMTLIQLKKKKEDKIATKYRLFCAGLNVLKPTDRLDCIHEIMGLPCRSQDLKIVSHSTPIAIEQILYTFDVPQPFSPSSKLHVKTKMTPYDSPACRIVYDFKSSCSTEPHYARCRL